jgi:hypothetical protein
MASLCTLLGLLVEAITLHWAHPTAFIWFAGAGGVLVGAGTLLYLHDLIWGEAVYAEAGAISKARAPR